MVKNTLDVYAGALNNFKVLIIKFSSLGDVILSTAALRALRERFGPSYKISFLVAEPSKEILLRCPYIDELLVCDFQNKDKGLTGFLKLAESLRKKNFDIAIDLQNNRKSHALSFFSLALKRYGYDNKKLGFLLNQRIKNEKQILDPVSHQFRILKMLGIDLREPRLELWPTAEDQKYADEFLSSQWLSSQQKIIGINIGASSRWLTKVWPMTHLMRLCEELNRRDIRIVLTGTPNDLFRAQALENKIPQAKLINSCGKLSINQLACLIKRCSVYISGDSAPLHVAASVDTPFIALFGPTDPRRHLPPAKKFVVLNRELLCSPCYKSKCKNMKCMNLITVEEVLQAVDKLLK
jgi:lipopolysaccharide heptosyltransferase II